MIGSLNKYRAVLAQYGLRRCAQRAIYALDRKSGAIQRRCPMWRWDDRPLAWWLSADAPADAGQYKSYRQSRGQSFFFPPGQPPAGACQWARDAVEQADAICAGKFRYFDSDEVQLGFPEPDWLASPITGQRLSADRHWCSTDLFDPNIGDVKRIWEPSRFEWAYALARAYVGTGDEKYSEAFWTLLESWMLANPMNVGPNWTCGQETAIRVLACTFALHVFWSSPATTDERFAALLVMLAGSAERIAANINYARSQMNNHSASESAGLYTVSVLFPELKNAQSWRKLAMKVLESDAREYNWADGAYTQHSMNYQRLMLQDYLWCMRLAQINGDRFSDLTVERVRLSCEFLYQLQDDHDGRTPNYGPNDGARIVQIDGCDYLDYRPIIDGVHYLMSGRRRYEIGPWSEGLAWLFGDEALAAPDDRPIRRSIDFPVGGYFTLRGKRSWAMVRCHSYRTRPNQADMLHMDLWLDGMNILRDSGSYTYYDPQGGWDNYFLSTAAHNTIVVGGVDQMIKGPRFRWFSMTKSRYLGRWGSADVELWAGEHYGYRRLGCKAVHRRTICRIGETNWLVVDDVLGSGEQGVELYWHFADSPSEFSDETVSIQTPGGQADLTVMSTDRNLSWQFGRGLDGGRRMGWRSLYYGQKRPTPSLCVAAKGCLPIRFVTLISLDDGTQIIHRDAGARIGWACTDGQEVTVNLAPVGADEQAVRSVIIGTDEEILHQVLKQDKY